MKRSFRYAGPVSSTAGTLQDAAPQDAPEFLHDGLVLELDPDHATVIRLHATGHLHQVEPQPKPATPKGAK